VALNFQPEALAQRFVGVPEEHARAFAADRGALFSGGTMRPLDVAVVKAQWPTLLGRMDAQLQSRPFLLGDAPCLADLAHYHPLWFIASNALLAPTLEPFAALRAWMARVAALGHGSPEKLSSEDAVARARAAEPEALPACDPVDPSGARVGEAVSVAATDYGVDAVAGTLAWQGPEEIVLARDDARAGRVHVHFPRLGFRVVAA
jgi:hypothetical protein